MAGQIEGERPQLRNNIAMATIFYYNCATVLQHPFMLRAMTHDEVRELVHRLKTLGRRDQRSMRGYMVDMYHYWGRTRKDPIAELMMRLLFEIVIGKLKLHDMRTKRWQYARSRDSGHTTRIKKLLRTIKSRSHLMSSLKKCKWISV